MFDSLIITENICGVLTIHRFHFGSAGKESACNVGDLGLIPAFRRSPGEGKGYPLQYSGLENSMDCVVHGVTVSRTQLSDLHFTVHGEGSILSTLSVFIHWIIRPIQSNSVQLILIIYNLYVHICFLVKIYVYNTQIRVAVLVQPFTDSEWRKIWATDVSIPSSGDLPFCFRSYALSRCPLPGIISATLGIFEVFFDWWFCCLKPKPSTGTISRVPEGKKVVLCLREKTGILDKLLQTWA